MALGQQPGFAQGTQMVRDPALGEPEGAHQFADRQLLALEERQDPQADRVGQQLEQGWEVSLGHQHRAAIITS